MTIATSGRDLSAAFALSLGPYRRGGEWHVAAVDAAAWLERRPPVAEVPEALRRMATVETSSGLRVPRMPAWVGPGGVALPEGAREEDNPPPWVLALRERQRRQHEDDLRRLEEAG